MSSLREQVIARIYEECADFPERTGASEEESCLIASDIGKVLGEPWPDGLVPMFQVNGTMVGPTWWLPEESAAMVETWIEYRA